ncbi:MAG: hypothetical protein JSS02_15640 [Planctomycetes bacterium]|nr:hypothetical protein [Planctomycetota bacterium]
MESQSSSQAESGNGTLSETAVQLTLEMIQQHPAGKIPEFTPLDDQTTPEFNQPASRIIVWFQSQVQEIYDPARQGGAWERDPEWAQIFKSQHTSGELFATRVRDLSLAIIRVRFDVRGDADRLLEHARHDLKRAQQRLEECDAQRSGSRKSADREQRLQAAIELGRAAALLPLAEMVHRVPAADVELVRKMSRQIKPVLRPHANDDLLQELVELARPRNNQIIQAGYEADESRN